MTLRAASFTASLFEGGGAEGEALGDDEWLGDALLEAELDGLAEGLFEAEGDVCATGGVYTVFVCILHFISFDGAFIPAHDVPGQAVAKAGSFQITAASLCPITLSQPSIRGYCGMWFINQSAKS